MPLKCERRGQYHIVLLQETLLDHSNAEFFKDTVKGLVTSECPNIIIEMSHVNFISSPGLGALAGIMKHVHASGGRFRLAGITPKVRSTFSLVAYDRIIPIYSTLEEALAS